MEWASETAFNPILVWFYPADLDEAIELIKESFQSHFGLILSFRRKIYKAYLPHFQSHFGLILSQICQAKRRVKYLFPFNPILVWFYL